MGGEATAESMTDADDVRRLIREAFANADMPPSWALRGSDEGDEPFLLEAEFKHVPNWTRVDAKFLDQAPGGFSTALGFFSDEAFRYYLPAYLLADMDGALEQTDLVFYLCGGFGARRLERVNPRRYGARTWLDDARHRFSTFDANQARAIIAYLGWRAGRAGDASDIEDIEATISFWHSRITELEGGCSLTL